MGHENDTDRDNELRQYIIIGFIAGVTVLLLLTFFCITFILCKMIKILRLIVNFQQPKSHTSEDNENDAETGAEPKASPGETRSDSSNKESPEQPQEADPASMYSVVSQEHCEKKRKASFLVQQYDSIDLPEPETSAQDLAAYENIQIQPKLQNTSFMIEDNPDSPNYSKLSHPGPRLSQTKRQEQRSREKNRKASLSAVKSKEDADSEVQPSSRPSFSTNAGRNNDKDDLPPLVPSRSSVSKPVESSSKKRFSSEISAEQFKHPAVTEPYEIVPITAEAIALDKDKESHKHAKEKAKVIIGRMYDMAK